jgi:hypothetical protein
MPNPIVRIHNVKTGEIVDREMTDIEFAQYQADQAANAAHLAEVEEKTTARQAVLDRLGITSEEAQLILGGSN